MAVKNIPLGYGDGVLGRVLCALFHLSNLSFFPYFPDCIVLRPQNIVPFQANSYTAIGDSFAAGLRAIPGAHLPWCNGSNPTNCTTDICLKNLGSYPYQLSISDAFEISSFHFLACAGSDTISCINNQINGPDFGKPDLVSLHVGGNNNNSFGPVMANCVYKRGWGCEEALRKADATIASIGQYLDDLFHAIRAKPRRDKSQARHVFAMGYPTFYNATAVGSCQSWQISWPSPGEDGMRQRLNDVVVSMNAQIKNATLRAGSGFHYVDTDGYFEGHRLCDRTDDVWFHYLLEWGAAEENTLSAPTDLEMREVLHKMEIFQDGPFHPNFAGHKAFLRALIDAISNLQHDERRVELR